MKRLLTMTLMVAFSETAQAEPVIVPTASTVPETVKRLTDAVNASGGKVFCTVDFGRGIRSIGEDVGEVQLVIFGDPRIGAQALSADRLAALDLPGKVLVYDTAEGAEMAYAQPAEMLAEWNIPAEAPVLERMARTLEAVTSGAAK